MTSKYKQRIDAYLTEHGLARSQAEAIALVMAGDVLVNEQQVKFASQLLGVGDQVRVKQRGLFVGRGGDKLLSAIDALQLGEDFRGKVVLDIGASTGGFSDCVLQLGASKVIAVDVGTNQLAWKLRADARVVSLENTDVRSFDPAPYAPIDWLLVDVSFIGLAQCLPPLLERLNSQCRLLLLIKPQFELQAGQVPKGGVVVDALHRQQAVESVLAVLRTSGIDIDAVIDSPVLGRQGNREVFCLARRL